MLAQRTADATVAEARAESDAIIAQSREEAERLLDNARTLASKTIEDTRADARRAVENDRVHAENELQSLHRSPRFPGLRRRSSRAVLAGTARAFARRGGSRCRNLSSVCRPDSARSGGHCSRRPPSRASNESNDRVSRHP